jgi:hypothetical protein
MIHTSMKVTAALCALIAIAACDDRGAAPAPSDEPRAEPRQDETREQVGGREEPQREPQEQAREQVSGREDSQGRQSARPGHENVLRVSDITGNTDQYVGKRVTVQGEVEEIYGTRGFKLNDEAPLRGGIDDDLIVVGTRTVRWLMDDDLDNDSVRVEGTVRRASASELERELGRQFETELQDALRDEPIVVIADDVQPRVEE